MYRIVSNIAVHIIFTALILFLFLYIFKFVKEIDYRMPSANLSCMQLQSKLMISLVDMYIYLIVFEIEHLIMMQSMMFR